MGDALVAEHRSYHRATTMLMGEISTGDTAWRAKIRDISAYGALVESDAKAHVGAPVVLSRGPKRAQGEVRWQGPNALGIQFSEPIEVEQWLESRIARGRKSAEDDVLGQRHRRSEDALPPDVIAFRVREEMRFVSRLMSNFAKLLSQDPILRTRHATSLQELGIGEQMLNELVAVLECDCSDDAVLNNASGPMRQRLLRAPMPRVSSCP